MMLMERSINGHDFDNHLEVTCNTCQRGTRTQVSVSSINEMDPSHFNPLAESDNANLPSGDELVPKFIGAMGAIRFANSPLGLNPMRVDYGYCRPLGDVQIPFRLEVIWSWGPFTIHVESAHEGRVFSAGTNDRNATPAATQ